MIFERRGCHDPKYQCLREERSKQASKRQLVSYSRDRVYTGAYFGWHVCHGLPIHWKLPDMALL